MVQKIFSISGFVFGLKHEACLYLGFVLDFHKLRFDQSLAVAHYQ